jgi:hypothetical protein
MKQHPTSTLPTLNPNLPPPIGVVPPLHLGPQMPIPQTAFWAAPEQQQEHIPRAPQPFDEDITAKKNFVRSHRLLPTVVSMLQECKKEGLVGQLNPSAQYYSPEPVDYTLDDFLDSQGISTHELENQNPKDSKTEEFILKFEQIRQRYRDELEKLSRVSHEFMQRMLVILRDQASFRPVTDHEIHLKLGALAQKFDGVRTQLKHNVCNAIINLQKQYNQPKKKRRQLSKQATEVLTNWFYAHINDPYPTEEEKQMLAAKCVLSINQINNWFGNKRIRNKRRNGELISGRTSTSGGLAGGDSPMMDHENSPPSSSSLDDIDDRPTKFFKAEIKQQS